MIFTKYLSKSPWLIVTIFLVACSPTNKEIPTSYGPATTELVELLETNPEVKELLITSIAQAKAINPDRNTNPAQNLEEYLEFVSWAETAMPWALLQKEEYPEIFDNIFQSIAYFHWIIDQPLKQLEGQDLVNNSLQYSTPFANWLITFCKSWGAYLDTEESWND